MRKILQTYKEYRDSGLDWLKSLPAHWRLERLKFIAEIRSGTAKGRDLSGKKTIQLPYLRVANVQENYLELDDVSSIEIQPHEEMRYSLKYGDVLMTEGGDNDKLGRGSVWQNQIPRCLHQNHVFAVRPFDPANSFWINWTTQTEFLKYFFLSRSKQTTNLASISSTNLKSAPILFPPPHERLAIAQYLDTKTTQIDRKIDLLTQKAQRYEELKRALINETITRGLDKSVPMKDSGIDWIGEIPEHWGISAVKRLANNQSDVVQTGPFGAQLHASDYVDEGIPLILIRNVKELWIDDADIPKITVEKADQLSMYRLNIGDIVFSRVGSIGRIALVSKREEGWMISGQMLRLRIKNCSLHMKYLIYSFSSEYVKSYMSLQSLGSTRESINTEILSNCILLIPSYDEQIRIATYLDTKTAQIDHIIQTINTQIEKLKELRKTLINDVVTGKIKVIDNGE